jgi:hypothetical protein
LTPPDHTTHRDSTADLPELDARMFLTMALWNLSVTSWRAVQGGIIGFPTYGVGTDVQMLIVSSVLANVVASRYERWQRFRLTRNAPPTEHAHLVRRHQEMINRVTPIFPLSVIYILLMLESLATPPVNAGLTLACYLAWLAIADFFACFARDYVQRTKRATTTT